MSAGGGATQHALSHGPLSERSAETVAVGEWSVMGRQVTVAAAPAAGDDDEGFEPGVVTDAGAADEPSQLGARRRADRAASSESSDRSVVGLARRGPPLPPDRTAPHRAPPAVSAPARVAGPARLDGMGWAVAGVLCRGDGIPAFCDL